MQLIQSYPICLLICDRLLNTQTLTASRVISMHLRDWVTVTTVLPIRHTAWRVGEAIFFCSY